jgi:hypothetical protein
MLCESPVNYVSIPCNISYYYLLMSHESYQLYHGIIVLQYAFSYWSLGLRVRTVSNGFMVGVKL